MMDTAYEIEKLVVGIRIIVLLTSELNGVQNKWLESGKWGQEKYEMARGYVTENTLQGMAMISWTNHIFYKAILNVTNPFHCFSIFFPGFPRTDQIGLTKKHWSANLKRF